MYPRAKDVDDAELYLIRADPDDKGMEELIVRFLGTINHGSVGAMRCAVTTEDGRNADKNLSVDLGMRCSTYARVQDDKTIQRTSCAPERSGWLPTGIAVNSTLRSDDGWTTALAIARPGFGYAEHAPKCLLACYLGPEGPIVSVTVTDLCPIRAYEMEVRIGSWCALKDRIELPR